MHRMYVLVDELILVAVTAKPKVVGYVGNDGPFQDSRIAGVNAGRAAKNPVVWINRYMRCLGMKFGV